MCFVGIHYLISENDKQQPPHISNPEMNIPLFMQFVPKRATDTSTSADVPRKRDTVLNILQRWTK